MRLYGLQPLRNSFQSIILIRLHSVFFRVGGCVTTAFSLCGFTDMPQTGLLRCSPRRMYHELLFCPVRLYGLQPLRNSFQSIILIRLHSVFFRVGGCVTTAFSLCGFTDMPQTGLLRCSPRRMYHELLFCPVRLYGLQPLRNSFQSIILIRLHSVFFRVGGCVTTAFSLCGFTDMPQTGLLTYSPQRLYHELLFLSHAALRTSTAPQPLSKYYPYPPALCFFLRVRGSVTNCFFALCGNTNKPQTGLLRCSPRRMYHELLFCPVRLYGLQPLRNSFQSIILIRLHSVFFRVGGCVTTAFSLCGFTDMPQTGLLTCSPFKLLPVLILRKKIRLQMQPYFQIYARYQIKDLYKAMISSLVGSFGLPGRQASSMAD